uniref:Platelet endothelial aggregation receptor 1 n=1 Tax=Latimeria chalumnae TaxID=7897 RepID=H3B9C8_LATCH
MRWLLKSDITELLLLAIPLLTAVSSLNPNDPNVCSYWESFTTTVKESYAHPFDQVSEEPCTDPWSFFRCTRHKITYKTAYRQGVKIDYRKRFKCCPGYYESQHTCVSRCIQECVHGRCVAPDRCQCEPGWRGTDCSSGGGGGGGGGGVMVARICLDKNSGLYLPVLYVLVVSVGARGLYLETILKVYDFVNVILFMYVCVAYPYEVHMEPKKPLNLKLVTVADSQSAQHAVRPAQGPGQERGSSISVLLEFCSPVFLSPLQGSVCSVPCPEGHFGRNCSSECLCHNGGQCDPVTGKCICEAGFTGDRCREECPIGTYGQDCSQSCDCVNGARCFHIHGACLCEGGFKGARCEERMCLDGLYGVHCQFQCTCDRVHTQRYEPKLILWVCKIILFGIFYNRFCSVVLYLRFHSTNKRTDSRRPVSQLRRSYSTCSDGFHGDHCSDHCPAGTFGPLCSLNCTCKNSIACSPIDGACFCKEGWKGEDCSIPCSGGTWGPGCNGTCQCANGAACSPMDGSCTCRSGWQGLKCDQPCPVGQFGPSCSHHCKCDHSDGCDHVTGQCHCLAGWMGLHCDKPCEDRHWGRNCSMSCGCKNGATCSPEDGSCICLPGYRGNICHRSTSFFNYIIIYSLLHINFKIRCYTFSACTIDNLINNPVLSKLECLPGTFGAGCYHSCICLNNATCDHVTGSCLCKPGSSGLHCESLADSSFVSLSLCLCVCLSLLQWSSGICSSAYYISDCLSMPFCAQPSPQSTSLENRTLGNVQCPKFCSPLNQNPVLDPPNPSTLAPMVPVQQDSLGAIIGIIVLVVLLVLLLFLFFWYRYRQKGKENHNLSVAYTPTRMASSEYAVPGGDVPHNYMHYYSNPSYHTLSQCGPAPPYPSNNHDRLNCIKTTNNQLFSDIKNMERERLGVHGPEYNATLPADWKRYSAPGKHSKFILIRSYRAKLDKDYMQDPGLSSSNCSINSENPYATIKDLPVLPIKPVESSYMEMKSPASRETSYAEAGLFSQHDRVLPAEEEASGGAEGFSTVCPSSSQGHYDSPKNSHIPSHYDLPPVRHYPPSPLEKRQDR